MTYTGLAMAPDSDFKIYLREEKRKLFAKQLRNMMLKMPKVKDEQRSPSGYIKHKEYCAIKHLKKQEALDLESAGGKDEIYTTWSRVFDLVELARSRPYFLSEQMADALTKTDIPDLSQRFQMVLPVLEVIVPSGKLVDDESLDVLAIVIVDCLVAKEMFDDPLRLTSTEDSPRYILCMFNEVGALMVIPVYADNRDPLPVWADTSTANESVRKNLMELRDVAMNLLLLYEAHPEYVGTMSAPTNAGSVASKKNRNSLMPARIIGLDFFEIIIRDTSSLPSTAALTGRKMPPHIRRGHWRRTRLGSGSKINYKWQWIRPVSINC